MTDPIIAVGDIHGFSDQLDRVLEVIEAQGLADLPVVFVGDYIDRGPDSRGVIDRLMQGQAEGRPWTCLTGNHDTFITEFFAGPSDDAPEDWIGNRWLTEGFGGAATLRSYGVEAEGRDPLRVLEEADGTIPDAHVGWLEALPRMHMTEDHVFVHGGIRPGVLLEDQDPDDLIWIREPFLSDTRDHGRLVVHGHTPGQRPEHLGNRVNLDGGAGYGRTLHPVLLEGRDAFVLTADGRIAL